MKAAVYTEYGGPDVVRIKEIAPPEPGAGEVLIKVSHSTVTTADWRLRAAAFPGVLAVPGRLMFGLTRPRNPVLGSEFAGTVAALGAGVSAFAVGDAVFGFAPSGAHAEFLTHREDGAVLPLPDGVGAGEAVAVPFGGLSALVFLRDFANLQAGQNVLVVGASGGVGGYAVQVARLLGAEVTGVASGAREDMVRALGATGFVDYMTQDIAALHERFDVVFDTIGTMDFARARTLLKPKGVFVPLNFGLREVWQAFWSCFRGGQRVKIGVNEDRKPDLAVLRDWMAQGRLRAVVGARYALADIRDAHALVQGRHKQGAVVIDIAA
ncbi:NAD(P)-dependent alcohol dehydrogenase [Primorskyibacter aestuariivivens]|uniref:NAD(P)-dependent alcohol dehydrogenase n=1 Tax=Primorskyibacter aestuariivivens TaxID=1888912 RepID=UPI00230194C1|nr:NAD(P)-dependent alcohol dehydrogenase [Primorskyibacter aestuariivivens]MDA7427146.1 NAD(P)-dependent alcohol dehydrogenase [Primorskyibacter aestuariivivens]